MFLGPLPLQHRGDGAVKERVRVVDEAGKVTVTGADVEKVTVNVVKTGFGATQKKADEALKGIQYKIEQSGDTVLLYFAVIDTGIDWNHPMFGGAAYVYNVIDVRQSYLQKLLKQALVAVGHPEGAERSHHFSYEMVALSHATARELGRSVHGGRNRSDPDAAIGRERRRVHRRAEQCAEQGIGRNAVGVEARAEDGLDLVGTQPVGERNTRRRRLRP